jgi:hypothetical protein
MDLSPTLRTWRRRYREYRIREREANRAARERVQEMDRRLNRAGLKSRNSAAF